MITYVVKKKGVLAANTKDEISEPVIRALRDTGSLWARRMLPDHFAQGAAKKYGFRVRTKRYMIRKARKKGHQNPLVWTGQTKLLAKNNWRILEKKSSETIKQISVRIQVPRYAWILNKDNTPITSEEIASKKFIRRPDMRVGEEITIMTDNQRIMLSQYLVEQTTHHIEDIKLHSQEVIR